MLNDPISELILANHSQGWYDDKLFEELLARFADTQRYDLALKMVEIRTLRDIYDALEQLKASR